MANFKAREDHLHRTVRNLAVQLMELADLRAKVRRAEKAMNRRRHVLGTKRMWTRAQIVAALAP
jgi:hypothetical protein